MTGVRQRRTNGLRKSPVSVSHPEAAAENLPVMIEAASIARVLAESSQSAGFGYNAFF